MEPTIALATCEQALRQLMVWVYRQKYGDGWLGKIVSEDDIDKWRARREVEHTKRGARGVGAVPEDELAYTDLYELRTIAERH